MSGLRTVSAETFRQDVLEATEPVLLDFWGPQCVPCVRLEPFVAGLSEEFAGRVTIGKVVAPENRRLCIDLRVMSLPTILAFVDGEEVGRLTGENEVTRETIRTLVERVAATREEGGENGAAG